MSDMMVFFGKGEIREKWSLKAADVTKKVYKFARFF